MTMKPNSDRAGSKDRIFFFHIPKCAGMSVWHTIWDAVGRANTYQVGIKEQRLEFESMSYDEARSFRAVGGHGFLDIFTSRLEPMADYLRVTVIRDPIDRAISEYNFIGGNKKHVRHKDVSRMTFEQFVEPGQHMSNMLTRFFARKPDPQRALEVLETQFDAWFLTPDVNRLNEFICQNFDITLKKERHENKSKARIRRSELDPQILRKLEETHAADLELFAELEKRGQGGQMLRKTTERAAP